MYKYAFTPKVKYEDCGGLKINKLQNPKYNHKYAS